MTATEVRRELEIDAALLAIAAGLIHAVAAVSHFGQYWLFGAFFAVLAPAQIAWGALVYRGAGRALLVAGAWGSAGVALLWLVTRTVGLPIGRTPARRRRSARSTGSRPSTSRPW